MASLRKPQQSPRDRYVIGDLIGSGGMGAVFLGRDAKLDRSVAIKVTYGNAPEIESRFAREVAIGAHLTHPNIVKVYDAGRFADRTPFLIMEEVRGKTLEELLRERPPNSVNDLLRFHVRIADALEDAHASGIIHRDIKPSNVMVDKNGFLRVMDLGLAKWIDEADRGITGYREIGGSIEGIKDDGTIVVGTPEYMAPEQADGKSDARSDVYSLGVCLYEALTGRKFRTFRSSGFGRIAEIVMNEESGKNKFKAEFHRSDKIPLPLQSIVRKAVETDANQRYQSAAAFRDSMQDYLDGKIVRDHHYSPQERIARVYQHHPRIVGSLMAGMAAGVIVLGLTAELAREHSHHLEEQWKNHDCRITLTDWNVAEGIKHGQYEKAREYLTDLRKLVEDKHGHAEILEKIKGYEAQLREK